MMQVGFNYPVYSNYNGRWIGPFPDVDPADTSKLSPLWKATLPGNLSRLKQLGVSVVRVFILENGFNYGPRPYEIPQKILHKPLTKWTFDPPSYPLDDPSYIKDPDGQRRTFKDHYTQLLEMFKSEKLQVIPSIIHFQAFLDPLPTERVQGGALLARGRADVVEDSVKRKVFFENVLKQFLYLSAPYVEQIYAIEIMNEPIFNTKNVSPTEPHLGNRIIAQDVMRDFLSQACEMIENAGFESTVGHRFFDDCLRYPTGTRAQFHYYPLPDYAQNTIEKVTTHIQIPGFVTEEEHWVEKIFYTPDPLIIPERNAALAEIVAAQAQIRPGWKKNVKNVFVGEFGSDISGDHGGPWPELKGEDRSPLAVVLKRLMLLSNKGYDLALVWPHKGSQATNLDRLSDKMDEDRWFALSTFARGAFK